MNTGPNKPRMRQASGLLPGAKFQETCSLAEALLFPSLNPIKYVPKPTEFHVFPNRIPCVSQQNSTCFPTEFHLFPNRIPPFLRVYFASNFYEISTSPHLTEPAMASTGGPSQRSRSMSIDEAIAKITTAVDVITLRGSVTDQEEKRVKEAFAMLAQPPGSKSELKSGKTSKRRESYLRFLRRVDEQCGSQLVVASAVGIGQSAIAGMKELTRLRLPSEIKKHEGALKSPGLQKVVNELCMKGRDTLSFTNMSSI
jgi:hypothetical protein